MKKHTTPRVYEPPSFDIIEGEGPMKILEIDVFNGKHWELTICELRVNDLVSLKNKLDDYLEQKLGYKGPRRREI